MAYKTKSNADKKLWLVGVVDIWIEFYCFYIERSDISIYQKLAESIIWWHSILQGVNLSSLI